MQPSSLPKSTFVLWRVLTQMHQVNYCTCTLRKLSVYDHIVRVQLWSFLPKVKSRYTLIYYDADVLNQPITVNTSKFRNFWSFKPLDTNLPSQLLHLYIEKLSVSDCGFLDYLDSLLLNIFLWKIPSFTNLQVCGLKTEPAMPISIELKWLANLPILELNLNSLFNGKSMLFL